MPGSAQVYKKCPCSQCLVLGGSRHLYGHRHTGQARLDIRSREPCRILASSTCVNVPHPRRLGFASGRSIVPDLDFMHQPGVPRFPGNTRGHVRVVGGRDGLRRRFRRCLPQRAGVLGDVGDVCVLGECVRTRRRCLGNLHRRTGLFGQREFGVGTSGVHTLLIQRDGV